MSITIIYHLYRNTENLKKSLDTLFNQSTNKFEVIFVDDGSKNKVMEIVKSYDWKKIEKVKLLTISENLGHSFSFNSGLAFASEKYIYYSGSNILMANDFVEKILKNTKENPDVVSFDRNSSLEIKKTVDEVLKERLTKNLKNKVFLKEFLVKNQIMLTNFKYFPLVFLLHVLNIFKKWKTINEDLCEFYEKKSYSYNLYNCFEQGDYLNENFGKTELWEKHKERFEYMIIFSILFTFLTKIFRIYDDKKTRKLALISAEKWLQNNIPNWSKNKVLLKNENLDDQIIVDYIKNFKFSAKYIQEFLFKGMKNAQ